MASGKGSTERPPSFGLAASLILDRLRRIIKIDSIEGTIAGGFNSE